MRDAKSVKHFKSMLMQFFTLKRSLYSIHDQIGVKLPARLRLKFSHLSKLKFRHKFKDCVKPMCNCGTEIETLFSCVANSLPVKDIISMTTFV